MGEKILENATLANEPKIGFVLFFRDLVSRLICHPSSVPTVPIVGAHHVRVRRLVVFPPVHQVFQVVVFPLEHQIRVSFSLLYTWSIASPSPVKKTLYVLYVSICSEVLKFSLSVSLIAVAIHANHPITLKLCSFLPYKTESAAITFCIAFYATYDRNAYSDTIS